ncbi:MAG: M23 family metallopeptidase [Alphaproteobacteria bacterium]|nr:M23 family metallopeptidase [Alphaproteobacteria bacterium]
MKKINISRQNIKKCIAKPHFQVFLASFSICLLLFFIISKQSGSNIPPKIQDAFDPIISTSNSVNKNIRPISSVNGIFDGIFSNTKEYALNVKTGDSIASMLSNIGVGYTDILEVSKSINPVFKLSDLRPDTDKLIVRVKPLNDSDEKAKVKLISLEIIKSPIYRIISTKTDDGFKTVESKSNINSELVRGEGIIEKGTSLTQVAVSQGIPYNVIDKFYEIFSFDVDFERDIYPGDKFQVMYEQLYSDNGEYLGSGEVIFASLYLNSRHNEFRLFRYKNEKGVVGYYDENGKGASKTLKKTPINGARISSKYGNRKHPVLGYSKAHKGVDFAAPTGTPIPAAGSGKVVFRGWINGYGNYIKIRHNGTYSTAYAHMSRFKPDVKVGTQVKQGQIIGYVGSTGLSTGPHLHYEIIKDGIHVNPLSVKLPSIQNLSGNEIAKFTSLRDKINIQFVVLDKNFSQFANLIDIKSIDVELLK